VIEIGKTKGNSPFIVMERLEGHDLAWHLRRTPQLDLPAVVELVSHTAMALSAVREAGIVHRDLKPGNLFLTDTLPREWKVLDFGLSKIEDGQALTKDQAVGTPAYMAPEQIQGLKVTHQTDQYALAALAYRALTGQPPFSGDDIPKILMDVLLRMPEPPQAFAKLPVDVELVLAIGLAKRPSDRFEIVEQFAEAFRRAAEADLDDKTRAKGWAVLKSLGWGERQ
jgi:serine/threonine-protein kinase